MLPLTNTQPGPKTKMLSSSVQSLVDTILKSVQSGELKVGDALPSIKYMRHRFRIAPTTVMNAYNELQLIGLVSKIGKTFWLGKFKTLVHPQQNKEVFLFLYNSDDFARVFRNDDLALAYRKMENELGIHGFVLRFESSVNFRDCLGKWMRRKEIPHGIVLVGLNPEALSEVYADLAAFLEQVNRLGLPELPVLIDGDVGMHARLPKRISILSRSNIYTTQARTLARFLVETNSSQVSFYYDQVNHSRYHRIFHFSHMLKMRAEVKHLDKNFQFIVFVRPQESNISPKDLIQSLVIPRVAERLLSKYEYTPYASIKDEIVVIRSLRQAFLQYPNAKTWVFAADAQAAEALDQAKALGIKVPDQMSVIGLENNPSFYHLGISRCEPDLEGIGYLMAHAIIRDFHVEKTTKGFIRTSANMVEKLTTK